MYAHQENTLVNRSVYPLRSCVFTRTPIVDNTIVGMQLKGESSLYNFEQMNAPGESSSGRLTPVPGNDPGPCRVRRRLRPHLLNVDR